MTNYGKYEMPLLMDELPMLKEALKIVLHSIFYHRWYGAKNINEIESALFPNISYLKINNSKLEAEIDKQVKQLETFILKDNKAQIILNFYEKKKKQYYFMESLDNLWETWSFIFVLQQENSQIKVNKTSADSDFGEYDNLGYKKNYKKSDGEKKIKENKEEKLRDYILKLIELLNDKIDYMPDLNYESENLQEETFPYEVSILSFIYN